MTKLLPVSLAVLATAAAISAQAPTVQISIAVRETGFAGGSIFTFPGDNGGATGGIEWVNRDGQTLVLDGTWQQFTFDFAVDPIVGFAGTSANSILEGNHGVLEHIRVLNASGYTDPITLWVDDIAETITPAGSSPQTTVFGDFQGYADNTEVMFQEPTFSGSTATEIMLGATAGIDNYTASRTPSYRFDFQFIDNLPTRWLRLTTFNTANQGNPMVRFDQQARLTFWMRGGLAQENLGSQGPGPAIAEMVGTGLMPGERSTYHAWAGTPATPGALFVSLPNQPDLPFLGGNLVSFSGFIASVGVAADANGRVSVPFNGTSPVFDVVFQSAFLDLTLPNLVTFTNANRIQFGL